MLKRTVTGLILIGSLIGAIALCYFVSPIILDVYILVWSALAVVEMYRCFTASGKHIHKSPLIFMVLAIYPVFYTMQHYLGMGLQGIAIVFLVSVAIELAMFTLGKQENNTLNDLTSNIFILVYPLIFLSLAFYISFKYAAFYSILFVALMPLGADTFAYFVGSAIKGKKLCPRVSPKKTVAGAVGGLLGSMLVAVGMFLVFDYFSLFAAGGYVPFIAHTVDGWQWKTALIYLAIGFIGGIVAEIGDLVASRIKRELGIKDYGKIFPGHGGVMDRLDSIMSGVFVLFIAFTIIYQI
ncbi:MAG: phosphatidate cytidylyltransferase [Clostridia bacterium]